MRISDWSSDVCSSDLSPRGKERRCLSLRSDPARHRGSKPVQPPAHECPADPPAQRIRGPERLRHPRERERRREWPFCDLYPLSRRSLDRPMPALCPVRPRQGAHRRGRPQPEPQASRFAVSAPTVPSSPPPPPPPPTPPARRTRPQPRPP